MNVISKFLILLALVFGSSGSYARSFSQCVSSANNQHRFEREESLVDCFQQFKGLLGSDNCYAQIKKLKSVQRSERLSEQLKMICFYDASIFQSAPHCLARAVEFGDADSHDEAIFECFNQFQEKLNRKSCIEMSSKLIYPSKKDYLLQHCLDI
jgi:hypothetical protein